MATRRHFVPRGVHTEPVEALIPHKDIIGDKPTPPALFPDCNLHYNLHLVIKRIWVSVLRKFPWNMAHPH